MAITCKPEIQCFHSVSTNTRLSGWSRGKTGKVGALTLGRAEMTFIQWVVGGDVHRRLRRLERVMSSL